MVVYGRETDVDSAENAAVVVIYYGYKATLWKKSKYKKHLGVHRVQPTGPTKF